MNLLAEVDEARTLDAKPKAPALRTALEKNLEAVRAPSSRRAYASAWLAFSRFATRRGESALPAEPYLVATYLSELGEVRSLATVRLHCAAIAATHEDAGLASPTLTAGVRRTVKGMANRHGQAPRQARALDAKAFEALCAAAPAPRTGRGGRPESDEAAGARARLDIALIALMRDAMLRRSEAAALQWEDLTREANGTGRILIRRSKTDQTARGAVRFFSRETCTALEALGWAQHRAVFSLSGSQISRRIDAACRAAGLGEGFSGHSPRIGMTLDLTRAGFEMPQIMNAGRWKSPEMVSLYTRNERAGRGAVAKWYGEEC